MTSEPPVARNLDPIYVRVVRDERHVNRCFTDLTVKEQQNFLNTLEKAGLKRMIMMLSEALWNVGDQLDLHLDD